MSFFMKFFLFMVSDSTKQDIREALYRLSILIDSAVYGLVNKAFKVFLALARVDFLNDDALDGLISRLYQLLGVVMLFVLSYMFLRKVIDPDKKDKDSTGKMIFSIVKAMVLLAVVPFVFTAAFKIQNSILEENTIGKVILGDSVGKLKMPSEDAINSGGIEMALGVYNAFLYAEEETIVKCSYDDKSNCEDGITFLDVQNAVRQSGQFSTFTVVAEKLSEDGNDEVEYTPVLSALAGGLVLYFLISYCLSLGFRVVKLIFYEVMAPVCIMASIIPSQKEMLSKWIKTTLTTFLEVFIRIGVLYFTIFLLTLLKDKRTGLLSGLDSGALKALGYACIVMGVVSFMKSAPDLISKLTGIDSNSMGLGIKEQLARGGFFTAGAIAGGALTSGIRNSAAHLAERHRIRNQAKKDYKNAINNGMDKDKAKKARNAAYRRANREGIKSVSSGLAGFVSGGIHGYSKDVKDFKSMKEAAHKGAEVAGANRDKRAKYKAESGDTFGQRVKTRFVDIGKSAKRFAGIDSKEALKAEIDAITSIENAGDALSDGVKAQLESLAMKYKGDKDLTFGGIGSTAELYRLKMNLQAAQANPTDANALRTAQEAYDRYLKDFSDRYQAVALQNNSKFEETMANLSDIEKVAMGKDRVNAEQYLSTLLTNHNSSYVQEANRRAAATIIFGEDTNGDYWGYNSPEALQTAIDRRIESIPNKEARQILLDDIAKVTINYENITKNGISVESNSAADLLKTPMKLTKAEDQIKYNRLSQDDEKKGDDKK